MNSDTKNIVVLAVVAAMALGALYYFAQRPLESQGIAEDVVKGEGMAPEIDPATSDERRTIPSEEGATPAVKLKAANFTGTLEKVDVGCFVDGECFVEVDGKHITTTMGWSQKEVGSVQGVEGFGDLESHIGEQIEVYAQDLGDGTYTLYGSAGFYIKLK